MTVPHQTAILIVGMHRSGTSALAGVLGKLGVPLGDRLLEPAGDNPKGYWEHEDVVAVHERLLAGLGSRWDDVRALPDKWLQSEPARLATAAIDEIISRDFSDKAVWSVKDPRLCRLLPLWLDVLARREIRPVALFMVRRPNEVSASIQARNHWRPLVGKLLWLRYMTEAVAATREVRRGVVLYDDLLANPISTMTRALASLGIAAHERVSVQEREAVAAFVDTSDRHHTNPCSEEPLTVYDSITENIYESLAAVAHGSNRWSAVEQATAAFHREWLNSGACIDAVADMAARIEVDARAARIENFQVTSALTAQIRWSEEAQAKQESLQAENAELSSKLTAQIRWSEEAQAKHESLQAENAELSSKLTAQIYWSEEVQAKHESLQAENAGLSSRLVGKVSEHQRLKSDFEKLQEEGRELSAQLQKAVVEAAQAREEMVAELEQVRINQLSAEAKLHEVYSSISWKLTTPLRAMARSLRRKIGSASSSTRKPE